MKKKFAFLTLFLGVATLASAKVSLVVDSKPLSNGLISFHPSNYSYFSVDLCDFTKEYDVLDESDNKVGTVKVNKENLKGYGDNKSSGYFTWTISTPGTY